MSTRIVWFIGFLGCVLLISSIVLNTRHERKGSFSKTSDCLEAIQASESFIDLIDPNKKRTRQISYDESNARTTNNLVRLPFGKERPYYIRYAEHKGALGEVTIHVVDIQGKSVPSATIHGGFYNNGKSGYGFNEQTDAEGLLTVQNTSTGDLNFAVEKEGYYRTRHRYWFFKAGFDCVKDGRWLPWNPTLEVVLKEKRKPIAMFVKKTKLVLPKKNKSYGFDCLVGDLVKPYGKGEESDLLFNYSSILSPNNIWSFTNQIVIASPTNGGIQSMVMDTWSELKSAHNAPLEEYIPEISFRCESPNRETRYETKFTTDSYLIFKSRVMKNEVGTILSENFGKIYPYGFYYGESSPKGDEGGIVEFCYYFNSTPNDRNLEFDGTNNLFHPAWNDDSWPRQP